MKFCSSALPALSLSLSLYPRMELSIANMHYNVYGNAYGIEVHTETPTLGVSSF